MKLRGRTSSQGGFTIVETLIVLAVSGVMLASVITLIAGKQDRTEFQTAINEAASQLQQVGRDIGTGYYPDIGNVQCNGGGGTLTITAGGTKQQGENQGCVFLGKVIEYGVTSSNGGSEQSAAFVLAGCEYTACGDPATAAPTDDLAGAEPKAIDRVTGDPSNFPSVTTYTQLQNGLSTAWVYYYAPSSTIPGTYLTTPTKTREFAVLQVQPSGGCSVSCTGRQSYTLYGIKDDGSPATPPYSGRSQGNLQTIVSKLNDPTNYVPTNQIQVCLNSGTTGQSGMLTLSGDGSAVATTIFSGANCT